MRQRLYLLLAVLTSISMATRGRAQGLEPLFGGAGPGLNSGGLSDSQGLPGYSNEGGPLAGPLGNSGSHGVYGFLDLAYYSGTWTLGQQNVAFRGLLDSTGALTGTPGRLIGTGTTALTSGDFGRRTFQPGYNIGIGYKLDDGTAFTARFMQIPRIKYNASASLAPRLFAGPANLADTFLWAPVFNFPPQFAGVNQRTGQEATFVGGVQLPAQLFYGIWNGASVMVISYEQSYTEMEFGARVPLFSTNYSSVTGLAGLRQHWFFERFGFRSTVFNLVGATGPADTATYTNTLSQHMWGPYLGSSHEIYLGKRFSLSTDAIGSMLVNFIKERNTYELGTKTIGNKRSLNDLDIVPYVGGNLNLWMYPLPGMQVRMGYSINGFFNTKRMDQPIGFNYGAIDPAYGTQSFRIMHGLNVGVGLFF